MTAEGFRSSQLRHLRRRVGRIRRLLYPGLSEALKARLGPIGGDSGGGWSTTAAPPPPDGHVRRYVGMMPVSLCAKVLRHVSGTFFLASSRPILNQSFDQTQLGLRGNMRWAQQRETLFGGTWYRAVFT